MTPLDLLILFVGALLLVAAAALLLDWRRRAVQDVLRPDDTLEPHHSAQAMDERSPGEKRDLIRLLVQRSSQSEPPGADDVAPEVIAEARGLVARRRKIEAIKLVRERTGWGLKQSKDFVDGLR